MLYSDSGRELTSRMVRNWLASAQRRAGLEPTGAIHRLRHTFCSMLASSAAPTKAIQELAGHQHISTTMKYMHLSPATRESAIRLLDQARKGSMVVQCNRGDGVETGRFGGLSS